jgi:pyruvate/2-oxoacid:ferredoxin oxidoreductase alpha subunit
MPSQERVDAYLPPYAPKWRLDVKDPRTFGGLTEPDPYFELRFMIERAMQEALVRFDEAHAGFRTAFGRNYDVIEGYRNEDAETLIVTAGALAGNARVAVDRLREEGIAAGLLRIRVFRPFPVARMRALTARARRLCVFDRNISFGAGGIFAQEIRSALYGVPHAPEIRGHVAGLGGSEVTTDMLCEMARETSCARSFSDLVVWKGLRDAPQHSD